MTRPSLACQRLFVGLALAFFGSLGCGNPPPGQGLTNPSPEQAESEKPAVSTDMPEPPAPEVREPEAGVAGESP